VKKETMLHTSEVLKNKRNIFCRKWPKGGSTPCTAELLVPPALSSAHSEVLNIHFSSNIPKETMSLKANESLLWLHLAFPEYTRHEIKYFNRPKNTCLTNSLSTHRHSCILDCWLCLLL